MIPIFDGHVDNAGKLKMTNRDKFEEYLKGLSGRVEIIVRKPRKQRSDPQNRYYWGVIVKAIADHTGHTKDEVHDGLRHMFLKDGWVIKSTKDLSTAEAEEYHANCRMWAAATFSLIIPLPNEVIY